MHLFEHVDYVPPTNIVNGVADVHTQYTGISAKAINTGTISTNWIDVRQFNSILFLFKYAYGAGTSVSFDVQISDTAAGTDAYPFPGTNLTVSGGTFTQNGDSSLHVTFPVSGASANFSLAITSLNCEYIRLTNIIAGGSPTTSDKLTIAARIKRALA